MRKNVISKDQYGNTVIDRNAVDMLKTNGTYLPDVERVIFNLKTEGRRRVESETVGEKPKYETYELENPILTTKIWWADGTTTTVKNSLHDKVEVEEVDVGGRKVKVATDCSKELGVAMATVKRTCGVPDAKGEIVGTGMGKILRDIVANGHDQVLEDAKAKAAKAAKKAEYEKRAAEPKKAKKKIWTQKDIIQMLGPLLERMLATANQADMAADEAEPDAVPEQDPTAEE